MALNEAQQQLLQQFQSQNSAPKPEASGLNTEQQALLKNFAAQSEADGVIDDVLASGRALRAGMISLLEGEGLDTTNENVKAAWASSKSDVKTSFMDSIHDSFSKIQLAPEGTYNSVITAIAKDPEISAAATVAMGLTGDVIFEPVNLLAGAGIWAKGTKAGQKFTSALRHKKAEKVVSQIRTRADELVDTQGMNRASAFEKAYMESDIHRGLLAEQMGVTSGTNLLGAPVPSKYVPTASKNILGRSTDKFFSGVGKAGEILNKPIHLMDEAVKPILTRVDEISPRIGVALREFEYVQNVALHKDVKTVENWVNSFHKLSDNSQKQLTKHLYNGDFTQAKLIMDDVGGMSDEFYTGVKPLLDKKYKQLRETNENVIFENQYFPRAFDFSKQDDFYKQFDIYEVDNLQAQVLSAISKEGRRLTPTEYSDILNKGIRAPEVQTVLRHISPEKARKVDVLEDDMLEYYLGADKAVLGYIRDVNHAVARRGFFGKSAKDVPLEEGVEGSIGALLRQEKVAGKIANDDIKELRDLLRARFIGGEAHAHSALTSAKSLGYMATLGNPFSALTQLGDLGTSAYVINPINTAVGVGKSLARKNPLTIEEFGLDLMAELGDLNRNAKWLDRVFKYSGFKSVDKLGKTTLINGSLNKWSKVGGSKKLEGQLRSMYEGHLGKDRMAKLIDDFKSYKQTGNISKDMKMVTFSDLLEIQPVVMSSMPKAYLNAPNARILWQLKTFMLKQLDLVRNTAIKKIRKGSVIEGTADLARYGILVGGANTGSTALKKGIEQWMAGNGALDDYLDEDMGMLVAANLFKTFGINSYVANQAKGGDLESVLWDFAAPPAATIGLGDIPKAVSGAITEEDASELLELIRYAPVVGRVLDYYLEN